MIESGIDPKSILMFTFTRKAADEMKARISNLIGAKASAVTICTYHSFCVKLLRKYGNQLGFNRNFVIYDEEDRLSLLKRIIKKYADTDEEKGMYDPIKTCNSISRYKSNLVTPQETTGALRELYTEYNDSLRAMNAFDFDDLQFYAIRLLETKPEVRKQVLKQYKYITAGMSAATIAR